MKKPMKPGDLYNAHMAKKRKVNLSGIGKTVGNAVGKATGWPKGLNDVQLNRSGTVGTEPISKGNNKYTEIKAGSLGKLDVPMGTLKKKSPTKKMKKNWIAGAIKKPGALRQSLGVKSGKPIPGKKLASAAKKPGVTGKRARLAETLKSFHKTKKMRKFDPTDTRLNASGTVGTEPISKGGNRYTEVKFGKLGAVDVPNPQLGKRLQNVGSNVRSNIAMGQKSPNASRANYSINPLKGSANAFMQTPQKRRASSKK